MISTFNDRAEGLLDTNFPSHPGVSYIVSHQVTKFNFFVDTPFLNRPDVKWIQHKSEGLARNRNFSLSNLDAEIGLIADDDVHYTNENFEFIFKAFKTFPDADIITFKVKCKDANRNFKNYSEKFFIHTTWSLLKISSIEIAVKKSFLLKHNLSFNENFGLGSKYCSGEECIFLINAKKLGAKIVYVPAFVVTHPYETSQRSKPLNKEVAETNGAIFATIWGRLSYLLLLISFFKNIKEFKSLNDAIPFLRFSLNSANTAIKQGKRS